MNGTRTTKKKHSKGKPHIYLKSAGHLSFHVGDVGKYVFDKYDLAANYFCEKKNKAHTI